MLKESKTYIAEHPRMSAYLLGLVIAIIATALETLRQRYMNYLVFTDSTLCFWNGINPYTQVFVNEHGRYFLYTPVFSVLYLPIALLPKWLGPFVWNLGNYTLFTLSIFSLLYPLPQRLPDRLLLQDSYTSASRALRAVLLSPLRLWSQS